MFAVDLFYNILYCWVLSLFAEESVWENFLEKINIDTVKLNPKVWVFRMDIYHHRYHQLYCIDTVTFMVLQQSWWLNLHQPYLVGTEMVLFYLLCINGKKFIFKDNFYFIWNYDITISKSYSIPSQSTMMYISESKNLQKKGHWQINLSSTFCPILFLMCCIKAAFIFHSSSRIWIY